MFSHLFAKKDKPQLLVVEDNTDQWLLIHRMLRLQLAEIEAVRVASVEAALAHLEKTTSSRQPLPKLILLDLYLPCRTDGLALLDSLKAHAAYRDIPVTMLSHSNRPEDIQDTYLARSSFYIVKPTTWQQWLVCFRDFRRFWWPTIALPPGY